MRGTDGQSKTIGSSDGSHGGDFRCGSLRVGQMFFANFLTNSYDNTFPSNHRSEAQSDGDGNLYPCGDELCGIVDVFFVIIYDGRVGGRQTFLCVGLRYRGVAPVSCSRTTSDST